MPSSLINGVRINHLQIECQSGDECEDIVMVHGLATNLAFWYIPHAVAFSERYRVTLYDLRGHGRSGKTASGYTPENMALDLQLLLNDLGIEKAHFIAHSFGGAVVMKLACMNPACVSSLILVDTHLYAVRQLKNGKEWEFGKKIQPILHQYGLNLDVHEPYFGYKLLYSVARLQIQNTEIPSELEILGAYMGKNSRRTATRWLELMETTQAEKELMGDDEISFSQLRNFSFPILAMYGEDSQAVPTGEQLLKVWPHADFIKIPGANHFFPITHALVFIEHCREFLDRILKKNLSIRADDSV